MSNKFGRMLDVLDLFSAQDTLITAEEVASRLNISRPTAFRYVRELSETGFLANFSGRYSLGARIITLDNRIRHSDPVLGAAREVMENLSDTTGCTSVLCRMYNEDIVNVHEHLKNHTQGVRFERGSPLPLFRGAASKVMLAGLPASRLRKICEKHREDPYLQAIGTNWDEIRKYFARVRRAGHYFSDQELEPGTFGIAAPVEIPGIGLVAAISLVFSEQRRALLNVEGLTDTLKAHASEVVNRLVASGLLAPAETEAEAEADADA
jgi:DNA-binding IclR family transcriptional regulator